MKQKVNLHNGEKSPTKKSSTKKKPSAKSPTKKRVSCSKHTSLKCDTTQECTWVPRRKPGCVRKWGGESAGNAERWSKLSRKWILNYAKNIGLQGRSKMTKEELIRALLDKGVSVTKVANFVDYDIIY